MLGCAGRLKGCGDRVPSAYHSRMTRHRLLALGLMVAVACSGSPVGPSGPFGPSGVIYFGYHTPGTALNAVWQVRPDGSGVGRVPHPGDFVSAPHVGLSGRWLAYGAGDIVLADLTNPPGSPELPEMTITSGGDRSYPLVSPSGQLVANTYFGSEPDLRGIRISRTDQSGIETLLTPPSRQTSAGDRAIGWFPGEDSLLISQEPDGYREYSIIHTDGTGKRPIGIPRVNEFVSVALSPTGRLVALAADGTAPIGSEVSRTVTIYDLATGRPLRSIIVEESVYQVLWSPDERFLAYVPTTVPEDPFDLAIVELATGARTVVLDIPGLISSPVWVNAPPAL